MLYQLSYLGAGAPRALRTAVYREAAPAWQALRGGGRTAPGKRPVEAARDLYRRRIAAAGPPIQGCRDRDLINWADERYQVPAKPDDDEDELPNLDG